MRIRDALRFLRYVNEAKKVQDTRSNVEKAIDELEDIAKDPEKGDISVSQLDRIQATIEDTDTARGGVNDWLAQCGISKESELYEKLEYICSKSRAKLNALVGALRKRFTENKGINFNKAFKTSFNTPVDVLELCAKHLGKDKELARKLYYTTWSDGGINHGAGEAILAMLCNGAETSVGKGNGDIKINGYPIEVKASRNANSSSAGRLSNGRDLKGAGAVRSGIFEIMDDFYQALNTTDAVTRYGQVERKIDKNKLRSMSIKVKYGDSSKGRIDNIVLSDIARWAKKYSVDEAVLEKVIREMVINFFKAIWGNFFFNDDEKKAVAKIIDSHLNGRKMADMLDKLSVIPNDEQSTIMFGYELLALYILRYIKKEGLLIMVEGKGGIINGTYLGKNILGNYKGLDSAIALSKELVKSSLVFAWPEVRDSANQQIAGGVYLKSQANPANQE